MSRHHKKLTLGALNDTWDEIFKQSRLQEQRVKQARNEAINVAVNTVKGDIERAKADTNRRLDKEIRDLERRTNSRLADLDRKHSKDLQKATDEIYDEIAKGYDLIFRTIDERTEKLEGHIDDVAAWTQRNLEVIDTNIRQLQQDTNRRFEQQQMQIDSLQDRVQDIFDHFRNEATMARDVVNEMTNLLQVVSENNPVQVYAPGELREIQSHINDLLTRCGNDPAAAIIAESRGIIRDILKMKEKTLLEKAKHDEILFRTRARLHAILTVIGENIKQPITRDGDTSTIATDFWTDGDYSEVQNKLGKIDKQLAEEEKMDRLSFDQIADKLKEIEGLNLKGVSLMQKAIRRAIQSQDRAEITLDIVNAMIRQGYEIKVENGDDAFDYIGGEIECDQREGVFAILRNPVTGEEVNVTLKPNPDDKTNSLHIRMRNPNQPVTEQQLLESIRNVQREMRESGYDIGTVEVPEDGGNEDVPEMHSGQQMRKVGASGRLRNHLS